MTSPKLQILACSVQAYPSAGSIDAKSAFDHLCRRCTSVDVRHDGAYERSPLCGDVR